MQKVACFSVHNFERENLDLIARQLSLEICFFDYRLEPLTAQLLDGVSAISVFANDKLNQETLGVLKERGVEMISLRSAGYSHLDLEAAKKLGLTIARVPSYSPEAIAEHATALMLCLNRKLIQASRRVRELNFRLDGLQGFTVAQKTVGVIGAGNIGQAFIRIMNGLGCQVLVYDPYVDQSFFQGFYAAKFVEIDELCGQSDIISLHCPLNDQTKYIINQDRLNLMKPHVLLINTGRGGLIHTNHLIQAIKHKKLGGVALDVYEHEEGIFFHDFSDTGIDDDTLARLLTFPNTLITSHQAFFTHEALYNIAFTSLKNISDFLSQGKSQIDKQNILL